MILSHPNKELLIHQEGVYIKARKRYDSELLKFVCLYHDLGKINPNFQNKINNTNNSGYTKHSLLSLFLLFYLNENKYLKLNIKELNIITNIIISHHGNLKSINNLFKINDEGNYNEIDELYCFLSTNNICIKEYFPNFIENISISDFKECIFNLFKTIQSEKFIDIWKNDSLYNYYNTLFTFSQLIESDKRDASDNEEYKLNDIKFFNKLFDNNINKFLDKLKINNELNELRTIIRNEANEKIEYDLNNNSNRMFSVTSPTGSGKTFMLLKLANTIQKIKGDYSIIFSIPFTSIIEQTSSIIEKDLLIDVLNITSISNSSKDIEKYQKKLENGYCDEALENLLNCKYSEDTFDNPFVLTTFVQLFETLISNKNSTLLKLPNFSKRIFLIDEIQSLPSDLYTFFYGILQHFCEKYDSYAIISSATMPNFELNKKIDDNVFKINNFFKDFKKPVSLLDSKKFYDNEIFNRYKINNIGEKCLDEIIIDIKKYDTALIIMNTVKDSLDIFNNLDIEHKYLLNKRFTSEDKILLINEIKNRLDKKLPVVLISTSLIEAGVDIDFPVVFRDIAPIANIIQTFGRTNREGKLEFGEGFIFSYYNLNEKNIKKFSHSYIHSNYDINFVSKNIKNELCEKELFSLQEKYYKEISEYKSIGRCLINKKEENLCELIYKGDFEKLGQFKLISNDIDEYKFYIGDDDLWNKFNIIYNNKPKNKKFKINKEWNIKLQTILKKINKFVISVNKDCFLINDNIMDINKIDKSYYSNITGLKVDENYDRWL